MPWSGSPGCWSAKRPLVRDPHRLVLAACLLAFGAWASVPGQVDEVYVVWGRASGLVNGLARPASGQGFDSPVQLGLMVLAVVAHVPPGLATKGMSALAGLGVIHVLDGFLPRRGEPGGAFGTLVLLALAASFPLGVGSAGGMETTLATALLARGWGLLCAGDKAAAGWLLAGAFVRPEGLVWLALGCVAMPACMPAFAAGVVGWVAWCVTMGLPSSFLEDFVGGGPPLNGFLELAQGALVFAPAWVGALVMARGRRPWAWAPLALHAIEVVRVGGDSMGSDRLLLPAIAALLAGSGPATLGTRWPGFLLLGLTLPSLFIEAHFTASGKIGLVARSWTPDRATFDLETPRRGDVEWLVRRPRDGAEVRTREVGMPLLAPWVTVRDAVAPEDVDVVPSTSAPPASQDPARGDFACSRSTSATPGGLSAVPADEVRDVVWNDQQFSVWDGDPGAVDWAGTEVRLLRWRSLFQSAPDQPWLRWNYARALADAGQDEQAERLARAPALPDFLNVNPANALFFIDGPLPTTFEPAGRGWGLLWNASLRSRPLSASEASSVALALDADAPGKEGARALLRWDCEGGEPQSVYVERPTNVDVNPPVCAGSPRRLTVSFTNDTSQGGDRNLWVRLLRAPSR